MKTRHPIILLLVAIAIAIAVIMIENPERSRVDDIEGTYFSPGFDSANVERVEVTQLLSGAELKHDGDRWLVSEFASPIAKDLAAKEGRAMPEKRWFRAGRGRVTSALGSFGGLEQGVVVSSNEDKRALFRVEATGLRVRILGKDGEVIEDLIVGKNGPDLASNYIRRTDEDDVYLVRRPLVGAFSPVFSDWRERRLWALKPEDIVGISVKSGKGSFAIEKGDGAFDDTAAAFTNVSAEGFPRDPDLKVGDEISRVTLKLKDGKTVELGIYEKGAEGYPARLVGVDETYILSDQFVESIPKGPAEK